jgi:hypothetical protein
VTFAKGFVKAIDITGNYGNCGTHAGDLSVHPSVRHGNLLEAPESLAQVLDSNEPDPGR